MSLPNYRSLRAQELASPQANIPRDPGETCRASSDLDLGHYDIYFLLNSTDQKVRLEGQIDQIQGEETLQGCEFWRHSSGCGGENSLLHSYV